MATQAVNPATLAPEELCPHMLAGRISEQDVVTLCRRKLLPSEVRRKLYRGIVDEALAEEFDKNQERLAKAGDSPVFSAPSEKGYVSAKIPLSGPWQTADKKDKSGKVIPNSGKLIDAYPMGAPLSAWRWVVDNVDDVRDYLASHNA